MTNSLEDLTIEKSLWEIYCAYWHIKKKPFNKITTAILALTLICYAYISPGEASLFINKSRDLASAGMSASLSILSLLVAAFAIYASLSDKSLFFAMAGYMYPNSNLTYLKYTIFSFMHVFILYIFFAAFCLVFDLLCCQGCLIPFLVKKMGGKSFAGIYVNYSGRIGFCLLGTLFFYVILVLKSFIFNIYHVFMASVRYQLEKQEL